MNVNVQGDYKYAIQWLEKASKYNPTRTLKKLGKEGVYALQLATPKGETGETAMGWDYDINVSKGYAELYFVNRGHPEEPLNIARLIELGHGTGTGGYVPPNPYIKTAMNAIFRLAENIVAKEVSEL
jgi:hypothetical protein